MPITDLSTLQSYGDQACDVIIGTVVITNLPVEVTEDILFDHLGSVKQIHGEVHVSNNQFLTSLSFMASVQSVHALHVSNNPNMVDARLPSLQTIESSIVIVSQCANLCAARYPGLAESRNDSGCANLQIGTYYRFFGSGIEYIDAIKGAFTSKLTSITNGTVR